MKSIFRGIEYKALAYRIFLAYLFYFIARILFYFYNSNLIKVDSVSEFLKLCYHGLAFDTTAILYANGLFILLSVLPFVINTKKGYQKFLFYVYFIFNFIAFSTNYIDLIYYKFTFSRTTIAVMDSLEHESNKVDLFLSFLTHYWHVFALFFLSAFLWVFLYRKVKVNEDLPKVSIKYFVFSIVNLLVIATLCVGGIRGDFKKSTRPINLVDANRHVSNPQQADIVLNTPFTFIRTMFSNSFKKVNLVDKAVVDSLVVPIKHYTNNEPTKPNVVLFILESFAKEYNGAFNKEMNIKDYVSYTPFVDSLAQHSLIFTNGYANGYKSIHGMSSVISGIPSFKDAFTSSPYPKQEIQSMVSILKELGYDTSFFHGAPNGSMGFLGYGNILGYDHYYGKTEFNNDAEFDGVWGIWDEPFFQFMNQTLSKKKTPFFATLFSVSSHDPYKVPEKYKGKFPKGTVNIHESIGYTDFALKQFFKEAKKQKWYQNTIFIFTADHGNTIYYPEYTKDLNRNTVPILFYSPSQKWVGTNNEWAQHIDIYPTLMDLIGYNKPFRSWGRSLLDKNIEPFVIRHSADNYQLMKYDYICVFDGKKAIGFYDKNDKEMAKNLIGKRNALMNEMELQCKAFVQDYMERIIDKKLSLKK